MTSIAVTPQNMIYVKIVISIIFIGLSIFAGMPFIGALYYLRFSKIRISFSGDDDDWIYMKENPAYYCAIFLFTVCGFGSISLLCL